MLPWIWVRGKRVGFWLGQWSVLVVLWFLFTDKLSLHEALVGAAAGALAAAGVEVVRGVKLVRFLPYPYCLLLVWRVPGEVLGGCWSLAKALVQRQVLGRRIPGRVLAIGFDPGGNDARSAARRALAVTFNTFAPNFIVIDIDRKQRLMLYHQVVVTGVPELARRLGAE